MRKLAIAMALASTALATPAVARDQSWYVGVEGGLMHVEDTLGDVSYSYEGQDYDIENAFRIDHDFGVDLDLIAGYDFGPVRAEAELGYKRAGLDEIRLSSLVTGNAERIEADGNVRVWSAMANLLVDLGNDDGWSAYIGGGAGLADVRYKIGFGDVEGFDTDFTSESDSGVAYQIIAGVRKAITPNLDLGLKYRFFNVRHLDFGGDSDGDSFSTRFRSHSLLASLVYNFAPPPPPPPPPVIVPPPPPPPATQTCPDGSVILATDTCPPPPEPYVPPPPPPPAPERG